MPGSTEVFSTLKNEIVAALHEERAQASRPTTLFLEGADRVPIQLGAEQGGHQALVDIFSNGDLELQMSNVHIRVHEFPTQNGQRNHSDSNQDTLQNLTLSLREISHDRDYGWIEIKHVTPELGAAILASLYEGKEDAVFSPEKLDKLLADIIHQGIAIRSNLGTNRAAITHRYQSQLGRSTHPDEFERAERLPAIKVLKINHDGSGERYNWQEHERYPDKPSHQWSPHHTDCKTASESLPVNGEPKSAVNHEPVIWIDIEAPTNDKLRFVSEHFKIPSRLLREGLAHELGAGIVKHREHTTIGTRILEIGDDRTTPSAPLRPHFGTPQELNIIVHGNFVITMHEHSVAAMSDTRRKYETGDTPIESHDGVGAVVAEILEECAKENISKLELLENSMRFFGEAAERRLFGLGELASLYALRKSFKAARDLLKREEGMPTELEVRSQLFRSQEPQSVCQGYKNKLETARDKASTLFDDANDYISRNGSRLGARAATGAVAALFVSLSQGYVQALADGSFEPGRLLAGSVLSVGVLAAIVAAGRAVRRGQW